MDIVGIILSSWRLLEKTWHHIKERHKKGRPFVEPAELIIIGLIFTIIGIAMTVGGEIWRYQLMTPGERASAPVSPLKTEPPKKKFYSQRNKSDIADALTDLLEILNTKGGNIVEKKQQFLGIWNSQVDLVLRQGKKPDTMALIGQLNDLSNLTVALNRTIFDEDGFVKKYQTYADELNPVLQLPPPQTALNNPISIFQTSINGFRDGISAIEIAEKYNDQRLISIMMENLTPVRNNFFHGDDVFRAWLAQTKQRINDLRNSLL